MDTTPVGGPAMPCPECRMDGRKGGARIGNRRNACATCNNFAQNVMRLTRNRLKAAHEEEYKRIRSRVELDLYPQVIEDFLIAMDAKERQKAREREEQADVADGLDVR